MIEIILGFLSGITLVYIIKVIKITKEIKESIKYIETTQHRIDDNIYENLVYLNEQSSKFRTEMRSYFYEVERKEK